MKCQILFSGKNKKNISKCRLLKILHRVLSVSSVDWAIERQTNQETNKVQFVWDSNFYHFLYRCLASVDITRKD